MKRILLTGGSGLLGKELLKIDKNIIAPRSSQLNILDQNDIVNSLKWGGFDTVIHCAAILDTEILEEQPERAIEANIIGTAYLAVCCQRFGIRLIYLSTDYVYPGIEGDYKETNPVLPFNFYAWTKLGGECAVKGVKNHLIIRTTFGPSKFPYNQAFSDGWRSKDYVDVIAPMIYEAATSDLTGVVNIGTDRKTMYSYARERNTDVKPVLIKDSGFDAPHDTSFNLDKWKNYKNGKRNM
jgi:dTDP-4-dehydrorhamnose reductase